VTLLVMWLTYTAFGVTFFSLVFLWAVRNRQFSDQDKARYLVLGDDAASEVTTPAPARRVSPVLYVPVALLLLAAALLGGTGWYVSTH
jgi:cbb3-type cytochrome oxidase maturation protein